MTDSVLRTVTFALQFTQANVCAHKPWAGIGDLPRKLEGGHPYTGVNIPALLGQLADSGSPAIFGSLAQWGNANMKVSKGSKGLGFIFMKSFKKLDKDADNLKMHGEDLDVSESGRILVPYASFTAFSQAQTDGYDMSNHHPILEVLKRLQMNDEMLIESGNFAREAAERYMHDWMLSSNANIRLMSEGERSLIIHLASDLVVGFNAGSMAAAGELNPGYPQIAKEAVSALIGRQIMRPWGIACDILRQLSPVFDENVKAGLAAAKLKQDDYKNKPSKATAEKIKKLPKTDLPEVISLSNSEIQIEMNDVLKPEVSFPVFKEAESVDFSSNW